MSMDHEHIDSSICEILELTFPNFDLAERCIARSWVKRAGSEFEIRVIVRISPVALQPSLSPVVAEPVEEIDAGRTPAPFKRFFQPNVCTAILMEG